MPRLRLAWIGNIFFIVMFLAGITANFWIPLVGIRDYAPFENRRLQSRPTLDGQTFTRFRHDYVNYYLDNFSVRYRLLELERTIRYRVFQDHYFPLTIIGEQNWLYFANAQALETCQGVQLISPERIDRSLLALTNAGKYLTGEGIDLYVLIVPEKCTVYPEYSIPFLPILGEPTYIDRFYTAAEDYAQLHTINVLPTLLEGKTQAPVYFQSDTHWNHYGLYLGYREIIGQMQPEATFIQPDDLHITEIVWHGDLAQQLGITRQFSEVRENYTFPNKIQTETTPEKVIILTNPDADNDQTLLVFHDSFLYPEFAKKLLANHYRRTIFLDFNHDFQWNSDPAFLSEVVAEWQPDVILLERTERVLGSLGE